MRRFRHPKSQRRGTGDPGACVASALPVPKRSRNRSEIPRRRRRGRSRRVRPCVPPTAPRPSCAASRPRSCACSPRIAARPWASRRSTMRSGATSPSPRTAWCSASATSAMPSAPRATCCARCRGRATGSSSRAPRRAAARGADLAAGLAALILIAAWIGYGARDPAPPSAQGFDGPAVAVLPFENLAGGERWDRLARGLTEEVIADLATNPWLFVLADATTRPHAGRRRRRSARRSARATSSPAPSRPRPTGSGWPPPSPTPPAGARSGPGSGTGRPTTCSRADRRRRGAGGRARRPLVRRHRPRRPRARPRSKTASLEAYELYLLGIEHKHRMTRADYDSRRTTCSGRSRSTLVSPGRGSAGASRASRELRRQRSRVRRARRPAPRLPERAVAADPDDPATLLEAAKQAAIEGDPGGRARDPARGRPGAERRGHPRPGRLDGPGSRADRAGRRCLGRPRHGAQPGGPDWYMTAKGIAAFAAGDDATAAEALRAAPPGTPTAPSSSPPPRRCSATPRPPAPPRTRCGCPRLRPRPLHDGSGLPPSSGSASATAPSVPGSATIRWATDCGGGCRKGGSRTGVGDAIRVAPVRRPEGQTSDGTAAAANQVSHGTNRGGGCTGTTGARSSDGAAKADRIHSRRVHCLGTWSSPTGRFELDNGTVVAMAPERVNHAICEKRNALVALRQCHRRRAVLPARRCRMARRSGSNDRTVYEPDALVRCGPPLPGDAIEVKRPGHRGRGRLAIEPGDRQGRRSSRATSRCRASGTT